MNKNIIPQATQRAYSVLHIWPCLPCFHCPRLTSLLVLDPAFQQPEPLCPLHGYTSASDEETVQELQMRFESVKRYALWMHGDTGRVVLVSPVQDLSSIPGYDLDPEALELEERGFHAALEDEHGTLQDAYVVWSEIDNSFYLYEHGALVSERREEVA